MLRTASQTCQIEGWLQRLQAGDETAREQLLACAYERLTHLVRKMLRQYDRVRRWEQTDDVMQNAAIRLYRALGEVRPDRSVDFFRLAAVNIRRELLDLAKHYYGPRGQGAHHASQANLPPGDGSFVPAHEPAEDDDPRHLSSWIEFHQQVELLPPDERDVFSLLWYQGLSQAEAAEALGISERTIKRRWQSARLMLHDALHGELPPVD